MTDIRLATKELHDKVEQTAFAQRLVSGDFTPSSYVSYMAAQGAIFSTFEERGFKTLPHVSLFRCDKIAQDMSDTGILATPGRAARNYADMIYDLRYNSRAYDSHMYLNYLGILFGGSIVAKNAPTKGRMYEFDDRPGCIRTLRSLKVDVKEVKRGFEHHILIMEELEHCYKHSPKIGIGTYY